MATNYPYYPQPQMPMAQTPSYVRSTVPQYMDQTQSQMVIKGRPVTSIEEARAMSIDFDGSVFYFPDLANKRIYTKQINLDGTSSLNVYEWKSDPVITSPQYVTREEFDSTLAQLKQVMSEQINKTKEASKPAEFNF